MLRLRAANRREMRRYPEGTGNWQNMRDWMVGVTGIEPVTPTMST